jgi:hypothetical protein
MMKSPFALMRIHTTNESPFRIPVSSVTMAVTRRRIGKGSTSIVLGNNDAKIIRSYHGHILGRIQQQASRYPATTATITTSTTTSKIARPKADALPLSSPCCSSPCYYYQYCQSRAFASYSSLLLPTSNNNNNNSKKKEEEESSFRHFTGPLHDTTSDTNVTANHNDENGPNANKSQKQKIFPWRESANEPLPRLLRKDDLSGLPNSTRSRFIKKLTVGIEMKVPLWQLFLTGSWEKELTYNCSWAFRKALAGLLSRTFHVPLFDIENNDRFLKFDYDVDESFTTCEKIQKEDGTQDERTQHVNDSNCDNSQLDNDDDYDDYIQAMVEENLLKLYTRQTFSHADESIHNDQRHVFTKAHLYLEPISSRLENIFLVPSLTRDDVKRDGSLRGAYTAIEKAFHETGDVNVITEMANTLMQKVSHGGSKRSIIMDVSIHCLETFYVKAGEELIQGNDKREKEEVTHLVRFEMQTTKGEHDARVRELGSWCIIDIDDQLHGNVWH